MAMKPQIIHSDPEILGGTPVFAGTRVPVKVLMGFISKPVSASMNFSIISLV